MRARRFTGSGVLAGALAVVRPARSHCCWRAFSASAQAGKPAARPRAVELLDGVPVGVRAHARRGRSRRPITIWRSPRSRSSRTPRCSRRWSRRLRARGRAAARSRRPSAARERHAEHEPTTREGGRGIAVIAARRLDSYTPEQATVTSWLGGFVWGPRLAPRQTWNLVDTTLRWQAGRWLVLGLEHRRDPGAGALDRLRRRR